MRIEETEDMRPTSSDSQIEKSRRCKELRVGDVLVRKRDNQKHQMIQIRGEQRRGVSQPSVGMIDISMNGWILL